MLFFVSSAAEYTAFITSIINGAYVKPGVEVELEPLVHVLDVFIQLAEHVHSF